MAPGAAQKSFTSNQAGRPVVPAIPLPLMAKKKQTTATALGSPVARQLVQTPAQTPRNGTPDFPQDNVNGIIGNVPPTPSSTADSASEAPSGSVVNGQTPPDLAADVAATEVVANGDHQSGKLIVHSDSVFLDSNRDH